MGVDSAVRRRIQQPGCAVRRSSDVRSRGFEQHLRELKGEVESRRPTARSAAVVEREKGRGALLRVGRVEAGASELYSISSSHPGLRGRIQSAPICQIDSMARSYQTPSRWAQNVRHNHWVRYQPSWNIMPFPRTTLHQNENSSQRPERRRPDELVNVELKRFLSP